MLKNSFPIRIFQNAARPGKAFPSGALAFRANARGNHGIIGFESTRSARQCENGYSCITF
jgi:hypothetical protein